MTAPSVAVVAPRPHPLAALFPLIEGAQFDALVADIRARGLIHTIVLYEDKILDGRNRWRACKAAGVEPRTEVYQGDDPLGYVISVNVTRRHLSESQRSLVAARLAKLPDGVRKDRQGASIEAPTQDEAAKMLHVGRSGVQRARVVLDRGAPELIAAVEHDTIAVSAASKLVELPPRKQARIVARIAAGEVKASGVVTELQRDTTRAKLDDVSSRKTKAAQGVYDAINIDPPWPMEKIERDVRPNQVALDYPTMTEDELRALKIPCAAACHVWVWTTHKHLPMALRLLEAWGLTYVCTFVWHKPGGPQPFGLPQYNCEFALYAHRGDPKFVTTKAFNTCFTAPRGRHSEKPNEFYEMVRRVTAGRRLDMFNRRKIEGFDGWGNEAAT